MDHHDSEDLLAPNSTSSTASERALIISTPGVSSGLLSHADGSVLLPEALPKLTALSWQEIRLALMLEAAHTPRRYLKRDRSEEPDARGAANDGIKRREHQDADTRHSAGSTSLLFNHGMLTMKEAKIATT